MLTSGLSYYILLSNILPASEYPLNDKYLLKTIRAKPEMFEDHLLEEDKEYSALMAIPHVDNYSYEVYRDMVFFNSFISDSPETYEFAENAKKTRFLASELEFINDVSKENFTKLILPDYNAFPVDKYGQYDAHPTSEPLNYSEAFKLFIELKEDNDKQKLYNQIKLYVFARAFQSINKIYQNTNMEIAYYVTILESIIGKPPICSEILKCTKCGYSQQHSKESLEQHFNNHYPQLSRLARKIRHATYHGAEYYDEVLAWIQSIMTDEQEDDQSSTRRIDYLNLTMQASFLVQKELIDSFLKLYQERMI